MAAVLVVLLVALVCPGGRAVDLSRRPKAQARQAILNEQGRSPFLTSKAAGERSLLASKAKQIAVCPGDTREDGRSDHDETHRVCAKIGVPGTSFWEFTGQSSWCGTSGDYGGEKGSNIRCPEDNPTWCICKWATAKWIAGEGCGATVDIDCEATDICNLKASYKDGGTDLAPARDCVSQKCSAQWSACPE